MARPQDPRWLQIWLGMPGRMRRWIVALLIAGLLAGSWSATYALGGTGKVPPHWFYVPIIVAGSSFGFLGAAIVAVASGILAGPLVPLDVAAGTPQQTADWVGRLLFFLVIGQVMAAVMTSRIRMVATLSRSQRAVSDLSVRLRMQRAQEARLDSIIERTNVCLTSGGPSMVLQPVSDLRSGRVTGVEALARFPQYPGCPPALWFAEAWEVGLGVDLEVSALRGALAMRPGLGRLFLAVNMSPTALVSPAFRETLERTPVDRLIVEITEHADVKDYDELTDALANLRARGVRVAVDDFGAGFAGFQHILRLDPDIIKLDGTLTRGINGDAARRAVAAGLIALAREIGAVVVAEGIETGPELQTLRSLDVDYGQGFYLARPAPLAHLDLHRLSLSRSA